MNKDKKTITIKVDIELWELLQKIKQPVMEFSWGAIKVSDCEASRILARKIKDSKIM